MKKIKTLIIMTLMAALFLSAALPVSARNYTFTSGADSNTVFAAPTQTDALVTQNPNENVRSNKDAAHTPPPYGAFSGDIPTELLSPYHNTQDKPSTVTTATASVTYSDFLPSSSASGTRTTAPASSGAAQTQTTDGVILPSTSFFTDNSRIQPLYYDDGSIGTLEIPRFNRTIKVYAGETEANMLKGAGHISQTSAWDGNCVIAAHNRGVQTNFGFLKDMNVGDIVKYTTKYGVRTYKVAEKRQVLVEDTTVLEWSSSNILTLITCIANAPELRLAVILHEAK
jgi:sortase A